MAAWMISFLAMAISCETRCLKRALRSLTISTLVSAGLVYGLDKSFHFITRPPSAQLSLGMNSISLGKLLLAAVPGALLMNRHVWRLLLLLLISALIFMTGARTIAIALAITILVFILINDGYNRKILRNIVLVLVAGATIGVMGVISRGIPLSRLVTLDTLYLRAEAWANALTIWWRMNPVTGVGPGMHRHYLRGEFRLDHLPYSYPAGHAHSEYLAALADLGVLGFLAWGGLLTVIFLALWKRRKENSLFRVSLAILVGYLVASLTEVHFMRLREMTLVIVVMVMGFAAMVIRTSAKHS
jgi:O-antigen ligase